MKLVRLLLVVIGLLWSKTAFAEPGRILVAAGSKTGLPAERVLKFADNDATRVRDVMVSLGGVRTEHAFLLTEPNKAQLFAAIDKAKVEAQKHKSDEVTLVFYFSGHGDREALHLGSERVLISDLSTKLSEVPAGLRIAVTDACRATRDKGFAADEPFAISATMVPSASGQVWLHASSDGEAAQESDELQGAIFTHAWLNGLRGAADSNGDARVTLDESFAFAHSQTLIRSAKSSGVLQKPEAVVTLREGAPVVLTQTVAKQSTLSLPQAKDTHFLVYSAGAKSVLSELWGSADRRLLLRLPPGKYVVQKRLGANGGRAEIAIAEGEERKLEDKDFSVASLELLARKGGDDSPEPDVVEKPPSTSTGVLHHELSAGYDTGANTRMGLVHGPRAQYSYAWSRVALTIGGGADFTNRSLSVEQKDESLTGGSGRAAIEIRFPLGALTLRGTAGGRAGLVSQSITRTGNVPTGTDATSSQTAFVFGPEIGAAARVALSRSFFFDAGATGSLLFLREEGSLTGIPGVVGTGALGARF